MPREKEIHVPDRVTLEDVRLIFRNFSGVPGRFNDPGDRNFAIVLDENQAKAMEADGWNIKQREPREEGDPPLLFLKVKLKYEKRDGTPTRPPRIVLITSRGKTSLTEDMIAILDWADIVTADLMINPYPYTAQGRSGLSAYLNSLFVTIREDPLEMKYFDVPDTAQSALIPDPDIEDGPG